MPLHLKSDEEGDFEMSKQNVLFVVTSTPQLMIYNFDESVEGAQALMMPYGEQINSFDSYLKNLKIYDDLEIKEWMRKAENREQEFSVGLEDDKMEANKKESMLGWFKPDRFVFDRKYVCQDNKTMVNADLLKKYVEDCLEKKVDVNLESCQLENELEYVKKVVG